MVKITNFFLVVFLLTLLSSCTSIYSNKSHYEEIDVALGSGSYQSALSSLQASKGHSYSSKDRVLFYLEEGMLYRYAGLYEESNRSLTNAEYAIEELLTKRISNGLLSGVLNDNALEYSGEDYEDIYINIFKALNYLQLNELEEALVEIRRVNFKLTLLESKYTNDIYNFNNSESIGMPVVYLDFHNDALARYLGIISYRLEGLVDDARIEHDYLTSAYETQGSIYDFSPPTLPEISGDKTYVNLFSFSGFAPEKFAQTIIASSNNNVLYLGDNNGLSFTSVNYSGMNNGSTFKLEFPSLERVSDPVSRVELYVDNQYYGDLELIENFDNISMEAFKVKQPLIIGKTILRSISKSVISEASEDVVAEQFGEGAGLLAAILGDIFVVVSENSDLRAARYFPSKIRGLELVMDPGFYNFSYVYYNSSNIEIFREDFEDYEIKYRGLNLIESNLMRKR